MTNHKNYKPLFHKKSIVIPALGFFCLFSISAILFFNDGFASKISKAVSAITQMESNDDLDITSLMDAANNNDLNSAQFFVKGGPKIVNAQNIGGATALNIAARAGNEDIVKLLITSGANVNLADNEGWTALMRAASFAKPQVIDILLANGADAGKTNNLGEIAIIHATESECIECLNSLFNKFDYSYTDLNSLKSQVNDAVNRANHKNNAQIQNLLMQFAQNIDKITPKEKIVNSGIPEKVFNFLGQKTDNNSDENSGLATIPSTATQTPANVKEATIIPSNNGQKPVIYNFQGKKVVYTPTTSTPTPVAPTQTPTLTPSSTEQLPAKTDGQKEIIFNFSGVKNTDNNNQTQTNSNTQPDAKSNAKSNDDEFITSDGNKTYFFLGKKYVPHKIKIIKKRPKPIIAPLTNSGGQGVSNPQVKTEIAKPATPAPIAVQKQAPTTIINTPSNTTQTNTTQTKAVTVNPTQNSTPSNNSSQNTIAKPISTNTASTTTQPTTTNNTPSTNAAKTVPAATTSTNSQTTSTNSTVTPTLPKLSDLPNSLKK